MNSERREADPFVLLTPLEAKILYYLFIANAKGYFTAKQPGISTYTYDAPKGENFELLLSSLASKGFIKTEAKRNNLIYKFSIDFDQAALDKLKSAGGIKSE